jgi:hypothetical protein
VKNVKNRNPYSGCLVFGTWLVRIVYMFLDCEPRINDNFKLDGRPIEDNLILGLTPF